MIVEVCANSLESALNAEKAKADRIELCVELGIGGITPSYGLLKRVQEALTIPVHVLIRPRSGDFTYSDAEFGIMKKDIAQCVKMGFSGIVSGVLNKDFTLDVDRTQQLVNLAKPLRFTFHRAFDWVRDPLGTLELLEGIGVDCILTSGQQKSAILGIPLLEKLHQNASKCTVLPGGGIRPENVLQFKEKGFKAIHFSASKPYKKLEVPPQISMYTPSFLKDDEIAISDRETIENIMVIVK